MSKRAYSPTPSEGEVDILGSLIADEFDGSDGFDGFDGFDDDISDDGARRGEHQRKRAKAAPAADDLDLGAILDGRGGGGSGMHGHEDSGDEDEDEAYIALQQAAAFRKSSNLKGNTVKKGGGFQALGRCGVAESWCGMLTLLTC